MEIHSYKYSKRLSELKFEEEWAEVNRLESTFSTYVKNQQKAFEHEMQIFC